MDVHTGAAHPTLNAAEVARRLEFVEVPDAWLARLDEARPFADVTSPSADVLSAWLARLGVAPEDAAEVLRTMPSPDSEPERSWLLERCHRLLARGLVGRASDPAGPLPQLPPALALFPVHLVLVSIDAIRRCHRDLNIPDDVSWETLSHLGRAMTAYRDQHGQAGIHLTRWDWLRFTGWLYQVGRLEVTPYWLRTHPKDAGPLFWYDDEAAVRLGPGFRKGDPALGVHVPAADSLNSELCDESFRRMRAAFANAFPGEPLRVATCTSWILDDQLAEYLPASSNLLAFQRRFQLVPGARDSDDAILHFVFGPDRPKDLDALPQRTTLDRAVVTHLRQGRHWRVRTGWLPIAE